MDGKVTRIKNKLYKAFEDDHAALGRGLYEIRMLLTEGDPQSIRRAAEGIIRSAGAHIAFEEYDFYPALKSRLSDKELSAMYLEHAQGLEVMQRLIDADDKTLQSDMFIRDVLRDLDILDHHVADCGNLFGAMGGLSEHDYSQLMDRLTYWRIRAPSWSEVADLSNHKQT